MRSCKLIFLWLLTVVIGLTRVRCLHKHHVKVCVKEKAKNSLKLAINSATGSFKDLVLHSDKFVDKSLLIKSILEDQPLVSLTYPKKWGKSINLDMLKCFLDIKHDSKGDPVSVVNDTWSYMYFKRGIVTEDDEKCEKLVNPPMISGHDDIIDKYLARYPVVHIDLSAGHSKVNNFDEYFDAVRKSVAELFDKYDFVVDVLRDKIEDSSTSNGANLAKHKNQLKRWRSYKRSDVHDHAEMAKSLDFLSQVLHEHFNQRVFVLIDNYDQPIRIAYFQQSPRIARKEAQKFKDFFVDLMTSTFLSNENVVKGVVTGILSLDLYSTPLLGLNHIVNYNAFSKNIFPFYGFTTIEVGQLLTPLLTPEQIKKVSELYNGYQMMNFPDVNIYDPPSIVKIVQNGKFDQQWGRDICPDELRIFSRLLRYEKLRDMFRALISRSVEAKFTRRNFTLRNDDVKTMNEIINGDEEVLPNANGDSLALMYFLANGFLTLDHHSVFPNWNTEIPVRIPNKQIEWIVAKELEKYYENIIGKETVPHVQLAAKLLVNFTENSAIFMRNSFSLFYKSLFSDKSFEAVDRNKVDAAHFLLTLYVKTSSNFEYHAGFNATYYDDSGRKLTPYILVHGKEKGLIFGFTYSEGAGSGFSSLVTKLRQYMSYYARKSVKTVRVLGLHYEYNSQTMLTGTYKDEENGVWECM